MWHVYWLHRVAGSDNGIDISHTIQPIWPYVTGNPRVVSERNKTKTAKKTPNASRCESKQIWFYLATHFELLLRPNKKQWTKIVTALNSITHPFKTSLTQLFLPPLRKRKLSKLAQWFTFWPHIDVAWVSNWLVK